jgi:photosystem I subunit VIII
MPWRSPSPAGCTCDPEPQSAFNISLASASPELGKIGEEFYMKEILKMVASFLPQILVPLVGLVFPAVAMAFLFLYIERDATA